LAKDKIIASLSGINDLTDDGRCRTFWLGLWQQVLGPSDTLLFNKYDKTRTNSSVHAYYNIQFEVKMQ